MKNLESFIDTQSLALRHANLMQEKEQLPPGAEISLAKKKEIERLEKALRKKLYKAMSSDVLPVIISAENKVMITFHFEVFSSMNTRIDRFKVDASTKEEAWKKAEEKAKKYPGKTKLKIS